MKGDSKLPPEVRVSGQSESDDADTSPTHCTSRMKQTGLIANPFELLNREQTPSDNEAKEDDDKENDGRDARSGDEDVDKSHSTDSLKRKKKRKKRKTKPTNEKSSEENADAEDEIEASVREVNKILGEPAPGRASVGTGSNCERNLYSAEHRHLNPDNEMKRIFGPKIIQAEQNKRRGRNRGYVRSMWLVQSRQNWPHVGKPGIIMNLLENKNCVQHFTFEHNHYYQQIQFRFLDAVDSFNPDNIVAILNMHPYHVDALLQLSEICKMAEDLQMASELIERVLYCFESCFHPLFNLSTGNCRLDYRKAENRSFFIALFKHLTFVGQRGCYRTALEFSKLLLGLDPDNDPLCVTLMIDFYALAAGEYSYLCKMFTELEAERNLSQLPNFAFSIALAKYHMAVQDGKPLDEADKMLQDALCMFPGILMSLLDKCSVQPDADVAKHDFFGPKATMSQPTALTQLICLYVGRCYHLWKEPEVVFWLEKNVQEVLKLVDMDDPLVTQCDEKRQMRYKGTPRNIYRHIMISEIKDAKVALPADMVHSPVMSYDPLPPTDAITSYSRPPRTAPPEDQNTLRIFFRSIFPNFSLDEGNVPSVDGQDNEAGASGSGDTSGSSNANDLRRSVTSLLDAMRDLLTNIHLPEVAQDADDSDTAHDN